MKREAITTKGSINFSDTSMFSEEETSRKSVGDRKKIVLTSRVKNVLSPRQQNKENLPNNISIRLDLKKKQKPIVFSKQNEQKLDNKHFQSESHFYMQSSCDCPQDKVQQQITKKISLKDLAHKHILRINRINQGIKLLNKLLTKPCFNNILLFSKSQTKQQESIQNQLNLNSLQKFSHIVQRWVSRVFLGNLRKYIAVTAEKQIQLAVQIIKNRDNELYQMSQRLSFRMLSFVFEKYNNRLLKQSYRLLKTKDKQPVLQHQKIYSFSNSIN